MHLMHHLQSYFKQTHLRGQSQSRAAMRSHWRPVRCALMLASLALCVVSFSSVVDADAWLSGAALAAGAVPAIACRPTPQSDASFTAHDLAHPNGRGLQLTEADARAACEPGLAVPTPSVPVPALRGQVILVNRAQQWLWAYQDGQLVFATPVTTGQPNLPTPLGTFHVMRKVSNTTFYSPWPKGSPYYYSPLHIDDALLFRDGGFYIHDAPWRSAFGPGTNLPQRLPDGTTETGSHGCVNVPVAAGAWLYSWAGVGATVVIVDDGAHQVAPAEHSPSA